MPTQSPGVIMGCRSSLLTPLFSHNKRPTHLERISVSRFFATSWTVFCLVGKVSVYREKVSMNTSKYLCLNFSWFYIYKVHLLIDTWLVILVLSTGFFSIGNCISHLTSLTAFNSSSCFKLASSILMWDWQTKFCNFQGPMSEEQWIFFNLCRPIFSGVISL